MILHFPWCGFERWLGKARSDLHAHRTEGLGFYHHSKAVVTAAATASTAAAAAASASSSATTAGAESPRAVLQTGCEHELDEAQMDALRDYYLTRVVIPVPATSNSSSSTSSSQ